MVKVENKETLRLLTKRFMKMNRARNIIAVIAIMLTSLLFTSLFVGSVSMILSKRATEIKQFMDSSHAIAQNLSEEDAERLQKTIEQNGKCLIEIQNTNMNTAKSLELLQKSMDNQSEFLQVHDRRCEAIEKDIEKIEIKMEG